MSDDPMAWPSNSKSAVGSLFFGASGLAAVGVIATEGCRLAVGVFFSFSLG